MSVLERVSQFIQRHDMLNGARGVVIAVSGGPDSVALLDVLIQLQSRDAGLGGSCIRVFVAHLNHKLRGSESDDDAEFVRHLAGRLALPVIVETADVASAAKTAGRGIEEIAREIRYNFLLRVAHGSDSDRVATGHTMSDQAETFLLRLARGSGLRGLAAMRPIIPAHAFSGEGAEEPRGGGGDVLGCPSTPQPLGSRAVLLIRPLLTLTREDVHDYCSQRALEFRTDATNLDLNYTRNRVRGDVLAALRGINPRVVQSIARAAENIAGDDDILNGLASSLLTKARLKSDAWLFDRDTSAYSVSVLLEQPSGMRRRMIIEAIRLTRQGASRAVTEGGGEVTWAHVSAVEALLDQKASGKHIALPASIEVWREFDALVLKRVVQGSESLSESTIGPSCPETKAGGFAFRLDRGRPIELLKSLIEGTRLEKQRTGRDWMTVALDDQVLPEHLVIRPRFRGERTQVIGKQRTIKLKNLMIDHRIPSSRRASWPLVTTLDGRYIWSPGLPPALEFAAHEGTQSLAIMRASAI